MTWPVFAIICGSLASLDALVFIAVYKTKGKA